MGKSKVTFPDGTTVEFPADTPPEQIRAILSTLQGSNPTVSTNPTNENNIAPTLSAQEMWEQGSKKERLAIFVRNHFMPSHWFSTIEVRDEQLQFIKKFVFGESPAISTYLNRLHDEPFLRKMKIGKTVKYQLMESILTTFPELTFIEIEQLLKIE